MELTREHTTALSCIRQGLPLSAAQHRGCYRLVSLGLVTRLPGRWKLTDSGYRVERDLHIAKTHYRAKQLDALEAVS